MEYGREAETIIPLSPDQSVSPAPPPVPVTRSLGKVAGLYGALRTDLPESLKSSIESNDVPYQCTARESTDCTS